MSDLIDKYQEYTSEELMSELSAFEDKKDRAEMLSLIRSKAREEEKKLRDEIKQEAEDTKEEKKLLKTTHIGLMDARKGYLATYRTMNAIMTGKSMLKHLDEYRVAVVDFKIKADEFNAALDAHVANLEAVKKRNG